MGIFFVQLVNGIPRRTASIANEISWRGRGGRAPTLRYKAVSGECGEGGGSRRLEE